MFGVKYQHLQLKVRIVVKTPVTKILLINVLLWLVIGVLARTFFWNPFWHKFKSLAESGQRQVPFAQLTPYDWDKLCVMGPYSLGSESHQAEMFEKRYQVSTKGWQNKIPNLDNDGSWGFLFIKDNEIVGIEENGFGYYIYKDFEGDCTSSTEAYFLINGDKAYIRY